MPRIVRAKPAKKSGVIKSQKGDHWFHSKSPAAKKAYIAKHPNSIYAKQGARKAAHPSGERALKHREITEGFGAARKARMEDREERRTQRTAKIRSRTGR